MSEEIDINETADSCECIICHYWYFLEINFRFQLNVCDGSHDMTQKYISFNNASITTVRRNYNTFHFWGMNKSKAVNMMKNPDLRETSRQL